MRPFLRNLIILLTNVILSMAMVEILGHRSDDPVILNRYSAHYFVLVAFYVVVLVTWIALSVMSLWKWDSLIALMSEQRVLASRYSWLLWTAPALLIFIIFAFSFVLNRSTYDNTPHSVAVPVALLFIFSFVVMREMIASSVVSIPSSEMRLFSQIAALPILRRFEAVKGRKAFSILAFSLMALVVLILFADTLFNPSRLIGRADLSTLHFPLEQFAAQSLRSGQLPFWNPYLFSGYPFLAHPQSIVFYPIQFILRLLLPTSQAISWGIAIHIFIAGVGMYALCHKLNLRPWIALVCALAFMLSSGFVQRAEVGHVWLVYALAWLPFLWLFLINALEEGKPAAIAAFALLLAFTLLSGHPTFPAYILLFLGLYWVYHAANLWEEEHKVLPVLKSAFWFSLMLLLGVSLAAVQMLPTGVLLGQIGLSEGYNLAYANTGALQLENLLMVFLPDAYPPSNAGSWELVPYLGVLLPLAAPFAFSRNPHRRLARFLGLVALLSLALAFGHQVKLFTLFYTLFPPFRVMRVPARAMVMWIPCIVMLGGVGLQALIEQDVEERRVALGIHIYRTLALVVLGATAGLLILQIMARPDLISQRLAQTAVVLGVSGMALMLIQLRIGAVLFPQLAWFGKLPTSLALFIISMILGVIFFLPRIPQPESIRATLVIGKLALLLLLGVAALQGLHHFKGGVLSALLVSAIVLVDLVSFGTSTITSSDLPVMDEQEEQTLAVLPAPPMGRYMNGDAPIGPNELMFLGKSNIDGYNSGMLTGYTIFLRETSSNPPLDTIVLLSNTSFPELDERALDFLNVTHVLSVQPLENEKYELVAQTSDYLIYRNTHALPRVFWVGNVEVAQSTEQAVEFLLEPDFSYETTVVLEEPVVLEPGPDTEAVVHITGYDGPSGRLEVQTDTSRAGMLVFSEPYYSERRIWIDGQRVQTIRANVGFTAAVLPPGMHKVELVYDPVPFYVGGVISLAAIIISLGLVLPPAWKRLYPIFTLLFR